MRPSEETDKDWIFARREGRELPAGASEDTIGKWMVFARPEDVDPLWDAIARDVRAGELAKHTLNAKVSTAARAGAYDDEHHVICVYTADWRKTGTVRHAHRALRRLGVDWTIFYKTNAQTEAGVYSGGGRRSYVYRSEQFDEDFHNVPLEEVFSTDRSTRNLALAKVGHRLGVRGKPTEAVAVIADGDCEFRGERGRHHRIVLPKSEEARESLKAMFPRDLLTFDVDAKLWIAHESVDQAEIHAALKRHVEGAAAFRDGKISLVAKPG
ncbi:hypothetical protein CKO28_17440 [Rhodovibrio sodomensis]|uniref:Uncharacterized protein n=1 Tax=Rhodovibrio sodomensis TaxID=1088 RepID=A0ABS1DH67_9PROT|nr:putative phosphothreonine lyase domain-containg protein [Rhodovibrio sodomensis]MBK1669822.1 hypothetical protein [Rhodovibrio sodomensis]